MLSGEPLTADGNVPFRDVYDGEVGSYVCHPGYDNRNLRVCPAVEIA
jgi:hypothetical protein